MKNLFAVILLFNTTFVFALNSGDFTIQLISAPYFVVDGNSPAAGPQSAYVGFEIKNINGSITYSNLKFTITSIGTSVVGQNYTLVSPASGITLVGTLAPGETKTCYYYVTYPANISPTATFSYALTDATASSKTGIFSVANRSSISANAGGLATQSISSQDLIGGIVSDDVTYTLGNTKANDENDFQVSISTNFDPTKLVLIKTQVVSSTIPGIAAGTTDSLYFRASANASSGSVTVRWTFKISAYNFTSYVLPYAGATSGSSNYKYAISTDLASGTPITISASANPLAISKTSDKTLYATSATALFTVTIQNPGGYPISVDKITDQIPAGFSYQALDATSGVTTSNSISYPSGGASGTITFEGGVVSGSNSSYIVPAGGNLVLKYTATAASYSTGSLTTTTAGFIGITQFGTAQNTVSVSAPLPLTFESFNGNFVNDKVILRWTTSSESNSSSFDVERSPDGMNFLKIGSVKASNYSTAIESYSFVDSASSIGTNYYRLKAIDINGNFKYSSITAIRPTLNLPPLEVVNPFYDKLQIKLILTNMQKVHIRLFDKRGLLVKSEIHHCNSGANAIELNSANTLSKGVYVLQVDIAGKTISRQVIKD